jgi:hypothetical protein
MCRPMTASVPSLRPVPSRLGLGCAQLTLIWHDSVPAVRYLERFTLWTSGLPSVGEGSAAIRISLWDRVVRWPDRLRFDRPLERP